MTGRRPLAVMALYALLALTLLPVYPHFPSPNEVTRWLLDAAIVEHRSIEVTRFMPLVGPRFEDVAERQGRIYSNKPPGAALVGLPGYVIARIFVGSPSPESMRATLTGMRLASATVPLLALAWLLVRLGRAYSVENSRVARVIWIALFATPLFAYGFLGFSHVLVAGSLFGAWALLYGLPGTSSHRADFCAGALLGLAVLSEYPAAVPVCILVTTLAITRRWSHLLRVLSGAVPFALIFVVYHHAAFGGMLRLANTYDRLPEYRRLAQTAFFGIGFPSPVALARLLFDPSKGLCVFAPVLLVSLPSMWHLRRRLAPSAWWTLVLMPLAILLFYSGYPNWHGGWTPGPRYIVPIIPFLAFGLLFEKDRIVEAVLSGWSLFAVVITSVVFPFVPLEFPFPWMSFSIPLLRQGLVAPNLLDLISHPVAIFMSFSIPLTAAAVVLRGRGSLYAVMGVLLAIVVGTQAIGRDNDSLMRVHRAYVAETYFEKDGSLARTFAPRPVPAELLELKRSDLLLPPAPWPYW